ALEFWIRIDSNRDEVSRDHTPIGLVISSHERKSALYERTVDLGGEQRVWIPLRFPVKQRIAAAEVGTEPWKSVSRLQLYSSEQHYRHDPRLVIDVGEVLLLRLTAPLIAGIDAPHHLLLPRSLLVFAFDVLGNTPDAKGRYTLAATLEAEKGAICAEARQDLTDPHRIALSVSAARPGAYTLRLALLNAAS